MRCKLVRVSSRAFAVAFVVAFAACGSPPGPNAPSGDGAWKELRISWGRQTTLTVDYDGGFIAAEMQAAPEGGGVEPVRRFSALDSQEVRELHRVVTPELIAKLGTYACTPETPVRIEVDGKVGCVPASADSPLATLAQMLEHHRSASHDTKPTHPKPPSGQGDPCQVSEGCGPGLVCVASPCVVAPCESGSCQKTGP